MNKFLKKISSGYLKKMFGKTEHQLIEQEIMAENKFSKGDSITFKDHKGREYIGIFLKKFTAEEVFRNVNITVGFMGDIEFNMYHIKDNSEFSGAADLAFEMYVQSDKKKAPTFCQVLIGNKKIITLPIEIKKLS